MTNTNETNSRQNKGKEIAGKQDQVRRIDANHYLIGGFFYGSAKRRNRE